MDNQLQDPGTEAYVAGMKDGMALQILARAPFSLVLTDPGSDDNPIVYVNRAFEGATGYRREEVVGRNCRFLQGADTDPGAVRKIAEAVAEAREVTVDILNYRADGSPFWNRLIVAPLLDMNGTPQYFVGVQKVLGENPTLRESERVDGVLREVQHRIKNHLSMVVSLIRSQARTVVATEAFETLARRVESVQLLYEELDHRGAENRDAIALGGYLSRVATAVADLEHRPGVRVSVDVDAVTVPMQTAVNLGLIVSEALTNALKHAFGGRESGVVQTEIRELADGGLRMRIRDDGVGMPEPGLGASQGLGSRIIRQLARGLGAELTVESGASGTTLTLEIPRAQRGAY